MKSTLMCTVAAIDLHHHCDLTCRHPLIAVYEFRVHGPYQTCRSCWRMAAFGGLSGNRKLNPRCLMMAHLYGPAARCKPKMMIWRSLVLRFCIRPIDGAFELLAIMDIRARSI